MAWLFFMVLHSSNSKSSGHSTYPLPTLPPKIKTLTKGINVRSSSPITPHIQIPLDIYLINSNVISVSLSYCIEVSHHFFFISYNSYSNVISKYAHPNPSQNLSIFLLSYTHLVGLGTPTPPTSSSPHTYESKKCHLSRGSLARLCRK